MVMTHCWIYFYHVIVDQLEKNMDYLLEIVLISQKKLRKFKWWRNIIIIWGLNFSWWKILWYRSIWSLYLWSYGIFTIHMCRGRYIQWNWRRWWCVEYDIEVLSFLSTQFTWLHDVAMLEWHDHFCAGSIFPDEFNYFYAGSIFSFLKLSMVLLEEDNDVIFLLFHVFPNANRNFYLECVTSSLRAFGFLCIFTSIDVIPLLNAFILNFHS